MWLLLVSVVVLTGAAAGVGTSVSTVLGTGVAGYSDTQVNNPYGLVIGPDNCLYFCDLDNQRIRRLDLKTSGVTTVAGNGERAFRGDGGGARVWRNPGSSANRRWRATSRRAPRRPADARHGPEWRSVPGASRRQRHLPDRREPAESASTRRHGRAGVCG